MNQEETSRRFYTTQHPLYCGIDLHARMMDVCILDQSGASLVQRKMKTDPETFLKALAPDRQGIGVAVEWMFPWDGLAALCADEASPFVLGQALAMQAIHGGKATNDKSDSQKMAAWLRAGRLPPADVDPATMRATRDWLRRRMPLAPKRAALRAHGQNTNRPEPLPAMGQKIASHAHRAGVAERLAEAAGPKSIEGDRALLPSDAALWRAGERPIVTTAKPHDAHPWDLRPTVPGIGTMLRRVRLSASPAVHRFPRGQAVVS